MAVKFGEVLKLAQEDVPLRIWALQFSGQNHFSRF
jgi:hypothetical protein